MVGYHLKFYFKGLKPLRVDSISARDALTYLNKIGGYDCVKIGERKGRYTKQISRVNLEEKVKN
ncbi:MAG: hypothetical protein ACP5D2_03730 [Candidatus Nanoarchaeia archaeon]